MITVELAEKLESKNKIRSIILLAVVVILCVIIGMQIQLRMDRIHNPVTVPCDMMEMSA